MRSTERARLSLGSGAHKVFKGLMPVTLLGDTEPHTFQPEPDRSTAELLG